MTDRWKCLVSRPKTALLSHISLKTTEYTDSGANFRLILPQYKESSPAPFSRGKAKIALFPKRKLVTLVFSFVAIIGLISAPAPANAGLLSFVAGLFDNNSADEALPKEENSQNMPLLKAALNLDPNPAKGGGDITVVGGVALLPDTGPSGTIADIEDEPLSSDNISLYVVRAGDSLSGIAKLFGVSANTILWANDIKKGQAIQPGQTLVILPVSGVQHTVVAGETVRSIAKKYKGQEEEILDFNGLYADAKLAIGDVVVIPDGEVGVPNTPNGSSSGIVPKKPARGTNDVPSYSGYYMHPLSGAGHKTQGIHGYNGVDIGAPNGTPVVASASGDVIVSRDSGWNGGYGDYLVIKHTNGTQTLYAHMNGGIVGSGARVVQGQVIGYVGNTGKSTGPHVHFEIRGAKNPF